MTYRKAKCLFLVLLVSAFSFVPILSNALTEGDFNDLPLPVGFQKTFETENLEIMTDPEGDSKGTFAIKNKTDGSVWYSSPPNASDDSISLQITEMKSMILISYLDPATNTLQTANSYLDSVMQDGMELFALRRGLRFDFSFPSLGIKVPVTVLINEDDTLSIRVQTENITEQGENRLFAITLLPYFCAASEDATGFIFVPDGSGAVIPLNSGHTRYASYDQPVYGGDAGEILDSKSVNTNRVAMPVYGIVRDGTGIFTVIDKGAAQSTVRAVISGIDSTWNVAYNDFELRKVSKYSFDEGWQGKKTFQIYQDSPIGIPLIENKYFFLSGDDAGITGMVKAYRSHIGISEETREEVIRSDDPEVTLALIGGIRKKVSFMGLPGMRNLPVTSFRTASEMIMGLSEQGIKNINVRYLNWSRSLIGSKIPSDADPHRVLGGSRDYRELAENLEQGGIALFPDLDPFHFTKTNFPFQQFFTATRNLNGQINKYYPYTINLFNKDLERPFQYIMNNATLSKTWSKLLNSADRLPSENLSFSGLGQIVSADYSDKQSPTEVWQAYERDSGMIYDVSGRAELLMLSFPNLPAGTMADIITEVPDSSGFDMTGSSVPFYQMVISGRIKYTGEAVNLSPGGTRSGFLRTAASGGDLYYAVTPDSTGDKLNDTEYADWISTSYSDMSVLIKQQQEELKTIYSELGSRIPEGREEPEPQIWKCFFKGGGELWINFRGDDVMIDGALIPAKGYVIKKGGADETNTEK